MDFSLCKIGDNDFEFTFGLYLLSFKWYFLYTINMYSSAKYNSVFRCSNRNKLRRWSCCCCRDILQYILIYKYKLIIHPGCVFFLSVKLTAGGRWKWAKDEPTLILFLILYYRDNPFISTPPWNKHWYVVWPLFHLQIILPFDRLW